MKILAFGHEKGVGKDTFAKFIVQEIRLKSRNVNVIKAGFADLVKKVTYDLYKWTGLMHGDFYEEFPNLKDAFLEGLGMTPRRKWIDLAEKIREYDPEIFLNALVKSCKADFLIIKDMRFPIEADFIRNNGGLVFKIIRPDVPHTSDEADDPLLTYTDWTATIMNDKGLKEFYQAAKDLVEDYFQLKQ